MLSKLILPECDERTISTVQSINISFINHSITGNGKRYFGYLKKLQIKIIMRIKFNGLQ